MTTGGPVSTGLVTCVPSRVEARALARTMDHDVLLRVGMGPAAARHAAHTPRVRQAGALLVAGIGGGVRPDLCPGDVVVATEVRGPCRTVGCLSASALADRLSRAGLVVHLGPVASVDHLVPRRQRAEHAAAGVLCVDMESVWLLEGSPGAAHAVVRVIADDAGHRLLAPGTLARLRTALRGLSRTGPPLTQWGRDVLSGPAGPGARDAKNRNVPSRPT